MALSESTGGASFAMGDPDDKTTQYYEKMVKPAILAAFQKNPGLPWVSFTLVLRNGIPVVHVASTNKSYDGWIEFRKTVAEMSEGLPQPLMVEVVEEKLEELGQPFPWRPFALGRSIGVERLEGSGTMGGYVTLTDKDGVKRIYGLTNNHVVNLSKTTNSPNADPQYVYKDNSIYLPSFDDLKSTRTDLNNKELQNMMIGTLKYASGRTMTDGAHPNILDWALVSVSEGTLKKDREEHKKDYKVNSEPSLKNALPNLGGPITTSGPLEAGMRVAKYGRSTGPRHGTINFTKERINMVEIVRGKGQYYNPNGVASVDEYIVRPSNDNLFSQAGDSGSWVVDQTGTLVGLLWGNVDERIVVTDITVVFASIEAKIGMKVKVYVLA